MKYLLTREQMRYSDAYGINDLNIPSIILMENAARSSADIIRQIVGHMPAHRKQMTNRGIQVSDTRVQKAIEGEGEKVVEEEFVSSAQIRLASFQISSGNPPRAIPAYQSSAVNPKLRVRILCGSGNNGGDGFAIARHLHQDFDVRIAWVGAKQKMSPETRRNYSICTKLGIDIQHIEKDVPLPNPNPNPNAEGSDVKEDTESLTKEVTAEDIASKYPDLFNCDIIVDALIGIGTSKVQKFGKGELTFFVDPQHVVEKEKGQALTGAVKSLVQLANQTNALRIAIDLPTGLMHGGRVNDVAFCAHHTITMAALKTDLLLNDAWDYCGTLHVADIGLPDSVLAHYAQIGMLEEHDVRHLIPVRKRTSSKFDYGRVCVIAGSNAMPGAAALCANAAIRSGAGLVELCTTMLHPALLPEVMPTILPTSDKGQISPDALPQLMESCKKADVIVIGCGLGSDEATIKMMKKLIDKFLPEKKIILDADGLRVLPSLKKSSQNLIITPHAGEFRRLFGNQINNLSKEELPFYFPFLASFHATTSDMVVVLKSFPVIITKGDYSYWCTDGNPGMATAGSGDVLAGVIGGLACRVANTFDAAAVGVWIHAHAGNLAAQKSSQESLTASAICDNLRFVFPK